MSIRQSLLALLGEGEGYGYQLRADFERRTGGTWPLNIGQVYSTLDRLERDGLAERLGADDEGRERWRITDAGRAEVRRWLDEPVVRDARGRDELAMKLALAVTLPGVDVAALVQRQRVATMRSLQDLTRAKTQGDDLAWRLVVEGMIFQTEAEARWLDHVEASVIRHRAIAARTVGSAHPEPAAAEPTRDEARR